MIQSQPGDGVPGDPNHQVVMDGSIDLDDLTPTIRRFGRPGRPVKTIPPEVIDSEQAELLGEPYQ